MFQRNRYMGRWYEIARLPIFWEEGCNGAMAEYSIIDDKTVNIKNYCLDSSRNITNIETGWLYPDTSQYNTCGTDNGSCSSLFPVRSWVQFDRFPGTVSSYWIEYTDYESISIVGGPDRKFLWLLSRTPCINTKIWYDFTEYVKTLGYCTDKLLVTGGIQ